MEFSGDGSVQALISQRICESGGSGCLLGPPKFQSEITGVPGQNSITLDGQIRLSRSKRYAVLFRVRELVNQLRDLSTGAIQDFSPELAQNGARPTISSNGMVVVPTGQPLLKLVTLQGTREITTTAATIQAATMITPQP